MLRAFAVWFFRGGFALLFSTVAVADPFAIYGKDNRKDFHEIQDAKLLALARSSGGLFHKDILTQNKSGNFTVKGTNYRQEYHLCPGEKFLDQDVAPYCSGALVAPDIILTAGHCMEDVVQCEDSYFAFDFHMRSRTQLPKELPANSVYLCKKILYTTSGKSGLDFALVQLDRPVADRNPLPIRQTGNMATGEPLMLIGHPLGLPQKIADGAKIRSVSPKSFLANLDAYYNNSGSPVFSTKTYEIVGVLVEGEEDFVTQDSCVMSKECLDNGCQGEKVTRVEPILKHLVRTPSKR